MKTISKLYTLFLMAGISFTASGQEVALSLSDALKLARENNKTLQVQKLEKTLAASLTKEALGNLLPSVSVSGSYSYYFDQPVAFMPGSIVNSEKPVADVVVGGKNAFSATLAFQQPLLNEVARKQVKISKLNEALTGQQNRDVEDQLVVNVSANYFTLQVLNESIALHKQSLDRNTQALNDSRLLLLQGKALKIDTLRNFIAAENLRSTISYLESQKEVARLQLNTKLGLAPDIKINASDKLEVEEPTRYFGAVEINVEETLINRSDVQQLQLAITFNKSTLEQTRAQRLPVVSLVGGYQWQAQANDLEFGSYSWPTTSYVGLHASMPIFTGNKINTRVRQSNIRVKQSQLALQDLSEQAKKEVTALQNKLMESLRQLTIKERTVEAAELSFTMVNNRYKNGLSSRLELTDAEVTLTQAKLHQLQAIYTLKITHMEYRRSMGLLNQ